MTESRIEITERLRRERRWSEACYYRDRARKRGRAEGLSRKEANERAWAEMADKFAPMNEEEIAAYPSTESVAFGHFPPSLPYLDADDELRFADIYFAIHIAIAMLHAHLNQSTLGHYRTLNGAMMYLIKCQAEEAMLAFAFAITDPVAFLVGPARKKFQAVEDRLTDAEDAGEQLDELKRKLIRSMLRSLNRMTTERVSEVVRSDFSST